VYVLGQGLFWVNGVSRQRFLVSIGALLTSLTFDG